MSSVTNEVKLMLDPNNDPFAHNQSTPERFGAKDVNDLSRVQILGHTLALNVEDVHQNAQLIRPEKSYLQEKL